MTREIRLAYTGQKDSLQETRKRCAMESIRRSMHWEKGVRVAPVLSLYNAAQRFFIGDSLALPTKTTPGLCYSRDRHQSNE